MTSERKLSDDQVRKIRELAASGMTPTTLAKRYGVSDSHICAIVSRRRRAKVQ